jgi:glycosyltransferase involved in cell wall biosynthesis
MSLTFLTGQVGYMKELGFRVHAISSPGDELRAFGQQLGVEVSSVEMPRRFSPLRDLLALAVLTARLHRLHPTIVHAHTPKGGLLGMLGAWLARVPVRIYHMRGLPMLTASGPRRAILRWTERISCALAHRVICVSHSIREVALSERLCDSSKIKVLLGGSGNGVDALGRFDPDGLSVQARELARERQGIPSGALVVGFVGRVVRDKGVAELVAAWRVLRDELANLHLLVVGPFEAQDPLARDVENLLREDPRVHLAGMDWNTAPLYAAMDVVALPTYREGFPNVPLEAASMRLPVVATRVPGCVDAVRDGVTGTLVPARDPHALADALRAYLRDPDLREQHGRAGRQRVLSEFRREAIWEAIHQEYVGQLSARGLSAFRAVGTAGPSGSHSRS